MDFITQGSVLPLPSALSYGASEFQKSAFKSQVPVSVINF